MEHEEERSLSLGTELSSVPPPSPLTGCYLLIVIGEPHTQEHKEIILQRLVKGLLSWDCNEHQVDLEKELAALTAAAPDGEEARYGERLIQFASESLVTEILIHPQMNTLMQCMRNLLSSFTRHRHLVHAGYTFAGNGSWIMQDGTFSLADFTDAYQENEVQRVIRAYENSISIDIHCSTSGGGEWAKLPDMPFVKYCKVRVNPTDILDPSSQAVKDFIAYVEPFVVPASLEQLLVSSDVVGNIRFSHPTLYVFPGGQGDAALFGINGFNMLVDGGFSRKACWWDFARHLDRLDAVLLTRLNNCSAAGMAAVLRRKATAPVYPQIGHFFCNLEERRALASPDGDKDTDPLSVSLLQQGSDMMADLRRINLTPQHCYRGPEPINLYHKVGHGTLDMYVLNPSKDSKYVREFLKKWHNSEQKLFEGASVSGQFNFPIPNLVSICALLVWRPANPDDTITRIMFPGSTPQHKIFEGLEKLKHLEFLQTPTCTGRQMSSVSPPLQTTTTRTTRTTKTEKKERIQTEEKKEEKDRKEERKEEKKVEKAKQEKTVEPEPPPPKGIKDDTDSKNIIDNKLLSELVDGEEKRIESVLQEAITARIETKLDDKIAQYNSTVIDELPKKKEGSKKVVEKKSKRIEKTDDAKDSVVKTSESKKSEIEAKTKTEVRKRIESRSKVESSMTSSVVRSKISHRTSQKSAEKKTTTTTTDRKATTEEKKSPPTTPKNTVEYKTSSALSNVKERTKPKPKKLSPSSTPAKSTKEAANRRVVESKYKQGSPKRDLTQKPPEKKETKPKREPISRRPRPLASPIKGLKAIKSPTKSVKSVKADPKLKGLQRVNYEDILKDAKKSDEDTSKSLDDIKQQELDEKEEQEIVREIEAVFNRDSEAEERQEYVGRSDIEKITCMLEDAKTEATVDGDFEEEYLIIEKEEVDQYTEDSVIDRESSHEKEDELQKHIKDKQESEKKKETSVEPTVEETKPTIEMIPEKETKQLESKEASVSVEEKQDISSEKKTSDSKSSQKPKDSLELNIVQESQPDEKISTTIESGATTAPTLPEDERIPLDDIKEDQHVEEKYVKEETKETEPPQTLVTAQKPTTFEKSQKLESQPAPIREIVKTPDEVADLPLHEEVDYRTYEDKKTPIEEDVFKRKPDVGFVHEIKVPKDLPLLNKEAAVSYKGIKTIQDDVVIKTMEKALHPEVVTVTPGSAPESPMYQDQMKLPSLAAPELEPVKEYDDSGYNYGQFTEKLRETHITTVDSPIKEKIVIIEEVPCMPEKIPSIPEDVEKEIEEASKLETATKPPLSPKDVERIVADVAEVLKSDKSLEEIMIEKSPTLLSKSPEFFSKVETTLTSTVEATKRLITSEKEIIKHDFQKDTTETKDTKGQQKDKDRTETPQKEASPVKSLTSEELSEISDKTVLSEGKRIKRELQDGKDSLDTLVDIKHDVIESEVKETSNESWKRDKREIDSILSTMTEKSSLAAEDIVTERKVSLTLDTAKTLEKLEEKMADLKKKEEAFSQKLLHEKKVTETSSMESQKSITISGQEVTKEHPTKEHLTAYDKKPPSPLQDDKLHDEKVPSDKSPSPIQEKEPSKDKGPKPVHEPVPSEEISSIMPSKKMHSPTSNDKAPTDEMPCLDHNEKVSSPLHIEKEHKNDIISKFESQVTSAIDTTKTSLFSQKEVSEKAQTNEVLSPTHDNKELAKKAPSPMSSEKVPSPASSDKELSDKAPSPILETKAPSDKASSPVDKKEAPTEKPPSPIPSDKVLSSVHDEEVQKDDIISKIESHITSAEESSAADATKTSLLSQKEVAEKTQKQKAPSPIHDHEEPGHKTPSPEPSKKATSPMSREAASRPTPSDKALIEKTPIRDLEEKAPGEKAPSPVLDTKAAMDKAPSPVDQKETTNEIPLSPMSSEKTPSSVHDEKVHKDNIISKIESQVTSAIDTTKTSLLSQEEVSEKAQTDEVLSPTHDNKELAEKAPSPMSSEKVPSPASSDKELTDKAPSPILETKAPSDKASSPVDKKEAPTEKPPSPVPSDKALSSVHDEEVQKGDITSKIESHITSAEESTKSLFLSKTDVSEKTQTHEVPSPIHDDEESGHKTPSLKPSDKLPSPVSSEKAPSPLPSDKILTDEAPSLDKEEMAPSEKAPSPVLGSKATSDKTPSPVHEKEATTEKPPNPVPSDKAPSPVHDETVHKGDLLPKIESKLTSAVDTSKSLLISQNEDRAISPTKDQKEPSKIDIGIMPSEKLPSPVSSETAHSPAPSDKAVTEKTPSLDQEEKARDEKAQSPVLETKALSEKASGPVDQKEAPTEKPPSPVLSDKVPTSLHDDKFYKGDIISKIESQVTSTIDTTKTLLLSQKEVSEKVQMDEMLSPTQDDKELGKKAPRLVLSEKVPSPASSEKDLTEKAPSPILETKAPSDKASSPVDKKEAPIEKPPSPVSSDKAQSSMHDAEEPRESLLVSKTEDSVKSQKHKVSCLTHDDEESGHKTPRLELSEKLPSPVSSEKAPSPVPNDKALTDNAPSLDHEETAPGEKATSLVLRSEAPSDKAPSSVYEKEAITEKPPSPVPSEKATSPEHDETVHKGDLLSKIESQLTSAVDTTKSLLISQNEVLEKAPKDRIISPIEDKKELSETAPSPKTSEKLPSPVSSETAHSPAPSDKAITDKIPSLDQDEKTRDEKAQSPVLEMKAPSDKVSSPVNQKEAPTEKPPSPVLTDKAPTALHDDIFNKGDIISKIESQVTSTIDTTKTLLFSQKEVSEKVKTDEMIRANQGDKEPGKKEPGPVLSENVLSPASSDKEFTEKSPSPILETKAPSDKASSPVDKKEAPTEKPPSPVSRDKAPSSAHDAEVQKGDIISKIETHITSAEESTKSLLLSKIEVSEQTQKHEAPSPSHDDEESGHETPSAKPSDKSPSPVSSEKAPSPVPCDKALTDKAPSLDQEETAPGEKAPSPVLTSKAPSDKAPSPVHEKEATTEKPPSPVPSDKAPSPVHDETVHKGDILSKIESQLTNAVDTTKSLLISQNEVPEKAPKDRIISPIENKKELSETAPSPKTSEKLPSPVSSETAHSPAPSDKAITDKIPSLDQDEKTRDEKAQSPVLEMKAPSDKVPSPVSQKEAPTEKLPSPVLTDKAPTAVHDDKFNKGDIISKIESQVTSTIDTTKTLLFSQKEVSEKVKTDEMIRANQGDKEPGKKEPGPVLSKNVLSPASSDKEFTEKSPSPILETKAPSDKASSPVDKKEAPTEKPPSSVSRDKAPISAHDAEVQKGDIISKIETHITSAEESTKSLLLSKIEVSEQTQKHEAPSPSHDDEESGHETPSAKPSDKSPSPVSSEKAPSPVPCDKALTDKAPSLDQEEMAPGEKAPSPVLASKAPSDKAPSPVHEKEATTEKPPSPVPSDKAPSPVHDETVHKGDILSKIESELTNAVDTTKSLLISQNEVPEKAPKDRAISPTKDQKEPSEAAPSPMPSEKSPSHVSSKKVPSPASSDKAVTDKSPSPDQEEKARGEKAQSPVLKPKAPTEKPPSPVPADKAPSSVHDKKVHKDDIISKIESQVTSAIDTTKTLLFSQKEISEKVQTDEMLSPTQDDKKQGKKAPRPVLSEKVPSLASSDKEFTEKLPSPILETKAPSDKASSPVDKKEAPTEKPPSPISSDKAPSSAHDAEVQKSDIISKIESEITKAVDSTKSLLFSQTEISDKTQKHKAPSPIHHDEEPDHKTPSLEPSEEATSPVPSEKVHGPSPSEKTSTATAPSPDHDEKAPCEKSPCPILKTKAPSDKMPSPVDQKEAPTEKPPSSVSDEKASSLGHDEVLHKGDILSKIESQVTNVVDATKTLLSETDVLEKAPEEKKSSPTHDENEPGDKATSLVPSDKAPTDRASSQEEVASDTAPSTVDQKEAPTEKPPSPVLTDNAPSLAHDEIVHKGDIPSKIESQVTSIVDITKTSLTTQKEVLEKAPKDRTVSPTKDHKEASEKASDKLLSPISTEKEPTPAPSDKTATENAPSLDKEENVPGEKAPSPVLKTKAPSDKAPSPVDETETTTEKSPSSVPSDKIPSPAHDEMLHKNDIFSKIESQVTNVVDATKSLFSEIEGLEKAPEEKELSPTHDENEPGDKATSLVPSEIAHSPAPSDKTPTKRVSSPDHAVKASSPVLKSKKQSDEVSSLVDQKEALTEELIKHVTSDKIPSSVHDEKELKDNIISKIESQVTSAIDATKTILFSQKEVSEKAPVDEAPSLIYDDKEKGKKAPSLASSDKAPTEKVPSSILETKALSDKAPSSIIEQDKTSSEKIPSRSKDSKEHSEKAPSDKVVETQKSASLMLSNISNGTDVQLPYEKAPSPVPELKVTSPALDETDLDSIKDDERSEPRIIEKERQIGSKAQIIQKNIYDKEVHDEGMTPSSLKDEKIPSPSYDEKEPTEKTPTSVHDDIESSQKKPIEKAPSSVHDEETTSNKDPSEEPPTTVHEVPIEKTPSPVHHDKTHHDIIPSEKAQSLVYDEKTPTDKMPSDKAPSIVYDEKTSSDTKPIGKAPSPVHDEKEPSEKTPSPARDDIEQSETQPSEKAPSTLHNEKIPSDQVVRDQALSSVLDERTLSDIVLSDKAPSLVYDEKTSSDTVLIDKAPSPVHIEKLPKDKEPSEKDPSPIHDEKLPSDKAPSPVHGEQAPSDMLPSDKAQSPIHDKKDQKEPSEKTPSPPHDDIKRSEKKPSDKTPSTLYDEKTASDQVLLEKTSSSVQDEKPTIENVASEKATVPVQDVKVPSDKALSPLHGEQVTSDKLPSHKSSSPVHDEKTPMDKVSSEKDTSVVHVEKTLIDMIPIDKSSNSVDGEKMPSDKPPSPVHGEQAPSDKLPSDKTPSPVNDEKTTMYKVSSDKDPSLAHDEIEPIEKTPSLTHYDLELSEHKPNEETLSLVHDETPMDKVPNEKAPSPVHDDKIPIDKVQSDKAPSSVHEVPIDKTVSPAHDVMVLSDNIPSPVQDKKTPSDKMPSDKPPSLLHDEKPPMDKVLSEKAPSPVNDEKVLRAKEPSDKAPSPVYSEQVSNDKVPSDKVSSPVHAGPIEKTPSPAHDDKVLSGKIPSDKAPSPVQDEKTLMDKVPSDKPSSSVHDEKAPIEKSPCPAHDDKKSSDKMPSDKAPSLDNDGKSPSNNVLSDSAQSPVHDEKTPIDKVTSEKASSPVQVEKTPSDKLPSDKTPSLVHDEKPPMDKIPSEKAPSPVHDEKEPKEKVPSDKATSPVHGEQVPSDKLPSDKSPSPVHDEKASMDRVPSEQGPSPVHDDKIPTDKVSSDKAPSPSDKALSPVQDEKTLIDKVPSDKPPSSVHYEKAPIEKSPSPAHDDKKLSDKMPSDIAPSLDHDGKPLSDKVLSDSTQSPVHEEKTPMDTVPSKKVPSLVEDEKTPSDKLPSDQTPSLVHDEKPPMDKVPSEKAPSLVHDETVPREKVPSDKAPSPIHGEQVPSDQLVSDKAPSPVHDEKVSMDKVPCKKGPSLELDDKIPIDKVSSDKVPSPVHEVPIEKTPSPAHDDKVLSDKIPSDKAPSPVQDEKTPMDKGPSDKPPSWVHDVKTPIEKSPSPDHDDKKSSDKVPSDKVSSPVHDDKTPIDKVKNDKTVSPVHDEKTPKDHVSSDKASSSVHGEKIPIEKNSSPAYDDKEPSDKVPRENVPSSAHDEKALLEKVPSDKVPSPVYDKKAPSDKTPSPAHHDIERSDRVLSEKVLSPVHDEKRLGDKEPIDKVSSPIHDEKAPSDKKPSPAVIDQKTPSDMSSDKLSNLVHDEKATGDKIQCDKAPSPVHDDKALSPVHDDKAPSVNMQSDTSSSPVHDEKAPNGKLPSDKTQHPIQTVVHDESAQVLSTTLLDEKKPVPEKESYGEPVLEDILVKTLSNEMDSAPVFAKMTPIAIARISDSLDDDATDIPSPDLVQDGEVFSMDDEKTKNTEKLYVQRSNLTNGQSTEHMSVTETLHSESSELSKTVTNQYKRTSATHISEKLEEKVRDQPDEKLKESEKKIITSTESSKQEESKSSLLTEQSMSSFDVKTTETKKMSKGETEKIDINREKSDVQSNGNIKDDGESQKLSTDINIKIPDTQKISLEFSSTAAHHTEEMLKEERIFVTKLESSDKTSVDSLTQHEIRKRSILDTGENKITSETSDKLSSISTVDSGIIDRDSLSYTLVHGSSSEDVSKEVSLEEKHSYESTEKGEKKEFKSKLILDDTSSLTGSMQSLSSHKFDEETSSERDLCSISTLKDDTMITTSAKDGVTSYDHCKTTKGEPPRSEATDSGLHTIPTDICHGTLSSDNYKEPEKVKDSTTYLMESIQKAFSDDIVQQGIKSEGLESLTVHSDFDRVSTPPTVPVSPLPKTPSSFQDVKITEGVQSEVIYDKSDGAEETITKVVHAGDDVLTQKISTSTEKVPKSVKSSTDDIVSDTDLTSLMQTMGKIKTETDTVTKIIKEGENVVTQTITTVTTKEIISREDGTPQNVKTTIETTTLSKGSDGSTTTTTDTQTLLSECSSTLRSTSQMDMYAKDDKIDSEEMQQVDSSSSHTVRQIDKTLEDTSSVTSRDSLDTELLKPAFGTETDDYEDSIEDTIIDTDVNKRIVRENDIDIIETVTTVTKKDTIRLNENKKIIRTTIETNTTKEHPDGTKDIQKNVEVKTEELCVDLSSNLDKLLTDLVVYERPEETVSTETEEVKEDNINIKRTIVTRTVKTKYTDLTGVPKKLKTVTTVTTTDYYPDGSSRSKVDSSTSLADIESDDIVESTELTDFTILEDKSIETNKEEKTVVINGKNIVQQITTTTTKEVLTNKDKSKKKIKTTVETVTESMQPDGAKEITKDVRVSISDVGVEAVDENLKGFEPLGKPEEDTYTTSETVKENGIVIKRKVTVIKTVQNYRSSSHRTKRIKTTIKTITEDEHPDGSIITKTSEQLSLVDEDLFEQKESGQLLESQKIADYHQPQDSSDAEDTTESSKLESVLKQLTPRGEAEESETSTTEDIKDKDMTIKRKILTKVVKTRYCDSHGNPKKIKTVTTVTTTDLYPDGSQRTTVDTSTSVSDIETESINEIHELKDMKVIDKTTDVSKDEKFVLREGKEAKQIITVTTTKEMFSSETSSKKKVKTTTETLTETKLHNGVTEISKDVKISIADFEVDSFDENLEGFKQIGKPVEETSCKTNVISENGINITRKITITTIKQEFENATLNSKKIKTTVRTVEEDEHPDGTVITRKSEKVSIADIPLKASLSERAEEKAPPESYIEDEETVEDISEDSDVKQEIVKQGSITIKRTITTKTKRETLASSDKNIKRIRTTVETTTVDEYPDGSTETTKDVKITISEFQKSSDSTLQAALQGLKSTGKIKTTVDKQSKTFTEHGETINQTVTKYITKEELHNSETNEIAVKTVTETITENAKKDGSVESTKDVRTQITYLPLGTGLDDWSPEELEKIEKQPAMQDEKPKVQELSLKSKEEPKTESKPKKQRSPVGEITTDTETFTKVINENGNEITQTITVVTTKEVISPEKVKITVETTTISKGSDGVTKTTKSTKTTISEFKEEYEETIDTAGSEKSFSKYSSKTGDLRSSSGASEDLDHPGIASPPSDISSRGSRAATHIWGTTESSGMYYSDDDGQGSPSSTKSQIAHSPRSNLSFELDTTKLPQHQESSQEMFYEKELHRDAMSTSIYGHLPQDDSCTSSSHSEVKTEIPSLDKSITKLTEEFLNQEKLHHASHTIRTSDATFLKEADEHFEKAIEEHKKVSGSEVISNVTAKYELDQQSHSSHDTSSTEESVITLKDLKSESKQVTESSSSSSSSKKESSHEKSEVTLTTSTKDPIESWGKPLGLPSPIGVPQQPGTPKKQAPNSSVLNKNKINQEKSKEAKRVTESPSKKKAPAPVYLELTYVPHHGNSYYSAIEFFKRVRARYYVFSGTEPSKEIYNALLDAKKTWENKDLEVTIIPTYDTDVLGYWVTENEEALEKYKIDLSPSASRCTINLQDHETSCAAYRLEF